MRWRHQDASFLVIGANPTDMRLIVGVDGSRQGMRALEQAVERARESGDELTVAIYSDDETPLETVETDVRDFLETVDFDAEIQRLDSDPGSRLVELAELEEYDQIVLPGGKQSPLGKIKITGTLEFVLLNARTSVTLVRE